MLLEDIWKGASGLAGGALEGVGDLAQGAWRSTRYGHGLERADQRKRGIDIQEQFDILKGNFSVEDKENAARKIVQMAQPKLYEQRIAEDPNAKFYEPTGQDLATSDQKTQKYLDPSGYRGLRKQTGYTPVDKVTDLGKVQAARDKFTTEMSEETTQAFAAAERFVNKRPTAGGEPAKDLSRETAIGRGVGLGPEFVDNRGLFSPTPSVTESKHSFEGTPQSDISEYFQVPTETIPVENVPKTHQQLGLANKQAEEDFEQLRGFAEKNMENFDFEQSYLDNQEHYNKLFLAMREGIPDGKGGTRKLTKKEIIEILRSMGQ